MNDSKPSPMMISVFHVVYVVPLLSVLAYYSVQQRAAPRVVGAIALVTALLALGYHSYKMYTVYQSKNP